MKEVNIQIVKNSIAILDVAKSIDFIEIEFCWIIIDCPVINDALIHIDIINENIEKKNTWKGSIYTVSNIVHGSFKHGNKVPNFNRQEDYIDRDIMSLVEVPMNKEILVFDPNLYKPSSGTGWSDL